MQAHEVRSVDALVACLRGGERAKYVFFWGHHARRGADVTRACLSQWYPASFTVDGVDYPTAEHFMMSEKARLFRDDDALARILAAPSPGAAKALGRAVRGFREEIWSARRFEIVVRGCGEKFRQNPRLGAFLCGTRRRVLVEASPRDRIWGIGLTADDDRAADPARWRGLNLLGFALMEARARCRAR